MENLTTNGLEEFKKEIKGNIKEAIKRDNVDKDVLELMLNMVEQSKLKINDDN